MTKRALLIAITYCNSSRKTLSGSWGDLALIQNILDYDEKILLFDEKLDTRFVLPTCPSKLNIMKNISNLVKKTAVGDTLLIYFCGHTENFSDNKLITADDNQITSAEFTDLIMEIKAGAFLRIVLDCSNGGKFLRLPYRYISPYKFIEMPIVCKKNIILLANANEDGMHGTNGVLTHALTQVYEESTPTDWLELYERMTNIMEKFKQKPLLLTNSFTTPRLPTPFGCR